MLVFIIYNLKDSRIKVRIFGEREEGGRIKRMNNCKFILGIL